MEQYTYKFCPDFGVPCRKPIVEIISGVGYEQECEDEGCIEIVLDPDSPDKCVQVLIFCEDCGSCPPIIKDICFCDNGNCGPCQICGPLGICIDVCKSNEFCEDDKCVECNPDTPCPANKICIDGKCVCPQGTFFYPLLNKCVECIPGEILDKCRVCNEQGQIVTTPCAGDCDPIEGCVDCLKDSTCVGNTDGRNCCSPGKKCVCCPGYIYDNTLKRCVIKPPCTVDSCGPCEKCDPILGCVPVICPAGFKCDPLKDDCVSDPCPPTPCKDATECGDKCGCNTVCVECAKLSCADCNKALGCFCNPLTGACEKVKDCNNPCTNKYDCAPGCGCDDATCKSCANYSCEECAKINGCTCTNSLCGDDDTRNPGDDDKCLETFEIAPVFCPKGELIATLNKEVSCSCDPIQFDITPPSNGNSSFNILPKKISRGGLINYSEAFNPFTSDLEYQVLSSLQIQITGKYTTKINGVENAGNSFSTGESVSPKEFNKLFNLKGSFTLNLSNYFKLDSVTITITHNSTTFTENKCSYGNKVLFTDSTFAGFDYTNGIITYSSSSQKSSSVTSTTKRDPLFVWYKNDVEIFGPSNIIKRSFVKGNSTYVDKITHTSGLFESGFSYKVTNDCSCKEEALYIWSCDKEKFFDPATLVPKITECGKKVNIKRISACSDMHTSLMYKVYINGEEVGRSLGNTGNEIDANYPNGVDSIELKVTTKNNKTCIKPFPVEKQVPPPISVTPTCKGGDTEFVINGSGVKSISYTLNGTLNNVPKTGGNFIILSSKNLKIEGEFENGCKFTDFNLTTSLKCCEDLPFSFTNGSKTIEILFKEGDKGLNTTFNLSVPTGFLTSSTNSEIQITNNSNVNLTIVSTQLLSEKSYSVFATKDECKKEVIIKLVKTNVTLTATPKQDCNNGILEITGDSSSSFKVTNTCNSFVWEGLLDTNGKSSIATNQNENQSCTYTLTEYKGTPLSLPISTTFKRLKITRTIDFDVDPSTDICVTKKVFVQLRNIEEGTSVNGLTVTYKLANGISKTAIIANNNRFEIPVDFSTPCGINTSLAIERISSSDVCFSNFTISKQIGIPCIVSPILTPSCNDDNKPVLYVELPNYVSVVSLENGLDTLTQLGSPSISGDKATFSIPLFNNAGTIIINNPILRMGTSDGSKVFCPIIPSITVPKCNKITLTTPISSLQGCVKSDNQISFTNGRIPIANWGSDADITNIRKNNFTVTLVSNVNNVEGAVVLNMGSDYTWSVNPPGVIQLSNNITTLLNNVTSTNSFKIVVSYNNIADSKYEFITKEIPLVLEKAPTFSTTPLLARFAYYNPSLGSWSTNTNIDSLNLSQNSNITINSSDLIGANKLYFYHLDSTNPQVKITTVTINGIVRTVSTISSNSSGEIFTNSSEFTNGVDIPTTPGLYHIDISYVNKGFACSSNTIRLTLNIQVSVPVIENSLYFSCAGNGVGVVLLGDTRDTLVLIIDGSCYGWAGFTEEEPTEGLNIQGYYTSCQDCLFTNPPCGSCGALGGDGNCEQKDEAILCGGSASCNRCEEPNQPGSGRYYCSEDFAWINDNCPQG